MPPRGLVVSVTPYARFSAAGTCTVFYAEPSSDAQIAGLRTAAPWSSCYARTEPSTAPAGDKYVARKFSYDLVRPRGSCSYVAEGVTVLEAVDIAECLLACDREAVCVGIEMAFPRDVPAPVLAEDVEVSRGDPTDCSLIMEGVITGASGVGGLPLLPKARPVSSSPGTCPKIAPAAPAQPAP